MKKIYFFTSILISTTSIYAQIGQTPMVSAKRSNSVMEKTPKKELQNAEKISIWESTFSDPSEWVIEHDVADCQLDFQIGSNSCQGSYSIVDINSTSANDGWALVDSDFYGGDTGGTEVEDSWLTMAVPVDLSLYPNVVVEFETFYRGFTYEKPYLVVGVGDGMGNVTWPTDLTPESDLSLYPNVYDVFPERTFDEQIAVTENPRKVRINISAIAGGQQEIFIRFNWSGTWGYAWFIDDFKIIEQPADDVESKQIYFAGTNNEGVEYGRTPSDQLDDSYSIGGDVLNFGINDQTNVEVDVDFVSFQYNYPIGTMLSAATANYESTETPSLPIGLYTGTYTVISDAETSGPDFGNNVSDRVFEVTEGIYSQDGIGNHPANDLIVNSMGSDSFDEPTDTYVATLYHLKNTVNIISGFEVAISPTTIAGAEMLISMIDTSVFLANGLEPIADLNGNSADGIYHTVSPEEVTNGVVHLAFLQPIELPQGAYYAVVKTIDYGGTPIRVLDDQTVLQPWYASMISTLDAGVQTSFSNGNSFAIRLKTGDQSGLNELNNSSFNVYPNPSNGLVNVYFSNAHEVKSIQICDTYGQVLNSIELSSNNDYTLDLNGFKSGIYYIKAEFNNGIQTRKITIVK